MKTIGVIATGFLVVVGALAVAIGVMSIPDVKRYLAIRNM